MALLERFWFGCGHCHDGAGCPFAHGDGRDGEADAPTLRGGSLVLTVVLVFVLPLVTALIAARLVERWCAGLSPSSATWCQTGGLLAGLGAGVLLARWVLAWMRCGAAARVGGAGDDRADS